MKANQKYINRKEAGVSAVVGVILMIAITIVIAATVYYYVADILPSVLPERRYAYITGVLTEYRYETITIDNTTFYNVCELPDELFISLIGYNITVTLDKGDTLLDCEYMFKGVVVNNVQ